MPRKKEVPLFRGSYYSDQENFYFPAPVMEVSLSIPTEQSVTKKSLALLDTGADITVIPERIVQQLQLECVGQINAIDYKGFERQDLIYSVELIFNNLGKNFIVRAITSNNNYVLVGRDILNKWSLLLDGRRKIFEIK